MKAQHWDGGLVLSVFPCGKGLGYAVFEGPRTLIEWGMKQTPKKEKNKNAHSIRKAKELFEWYQPSFVVLEDYAGKASRRAPRIRKLIEGIGRVAADRGIETAPYSRAQIRACFEGAGATNKYEIAQAIARQFPELSHRLPPPRKIWMPEDLRISIFDAAALGLTFFHFAASVRNAA